MTHRAILIAFVFFLGSLRLSAAILGGPITNAVNGHVYYILEQSTWTAADTEARALGGHLVTIENEAEQLWVYSTFSAWNGVYRTLWIGLGDADSEGDFRWRDGTGLTYQNWGDREPNNIGNEDYVHILGPNSHMPGKWNDFQSTALVWAENTGAQAAFHGVVEIPPVKLSIVVSEITLRFQSIAGKRYQIQTADGVKGTGWENFGEPIIGTGSLIEIPDRTNERAGRLYRVLTLP